MALRKNQARVIALAAALALTASACGGGDDGDASPGAPGGTKAPEAGKKGGTLTLLMASDFEHLDPQRTYVSNAFSFSTRLTTRTLVTYDSKPGPAGNTIVPDMATDTGKASEDLKTWTFTLKDGIKFDDGSPVTCADIKYGISRAFSSQITDGPHWPHNQLAIEKKDGVEVYKGPYVPGPDGGFDKAVECPDDKTVVFNLAAPTADFNKSLGWPVWAPVPKSRDTKTQYDKKFVSTGPYMIDTYVADKSLTLKRNPNWDAATDKVRMAYPDKIVATFGVTGNVIDSRLIADAPADQTAMSGETIQAQNIGRAMSDPRIKNRVITGNDNSAWYVAINNKKVPNVKVRQAIQALVNKETYRGTLGGEAVGDYANGVIPPAIEGYEDFKVPDVPPQGDPALAEKLLKESGETLPISMKYDFGNTEQNAKAAAALQQALQRSPNLKITLNPIARDVYYSTIGKTAAQSELSLAGWGPDWPDASTVIPPILDGRNIVPEGNNNYAQFDDPEFNKGVDEARAEPDNAKRAKLWGALNKQAIEKAAVAPLYFRKANYLIGSKVKGAFFHAWYGDPDFATISVQ